MVIEGGCLMINGADEAIGGEMDSCPEEGPTFVVLWPKEALYKRFDLGEEVSPFSKCLKRTILRFGAVLCELVGKV